jgi:hypothetical protein
MADDDLADHIGQVGVRIDAVEFAGLEAPTSAGLRARTGAGRSLTILGWWPWNLLPLALIAAPPTKNR